VLSVVLWPFIPESCERLRDMLGVKELSWDEVKKFNFQGKINKPEILFKKVD
jgi:methionyl-tRNA synthetase